METFFWVKARAGRATYSYGPYLSFEAAVPILMERLTTFLSAEEIDTEQIYAFITEETVIDGEWILVSTKVKEKRWNQF